MTPWVSILVSMGLAAALVAVWIKWRTAVRAEFIRNYTFPKGLFAKLQKRQPGLTLKDCQLVSHGLRQFFLAHLKSGCRFVSMPSQVVDDLWHELILYTRNYDSFCRKAFGRFLHHTPAAVLSSNRQNNAGLRRCWWYACVEENINPRKATRLPLLFAIDAKLNIPDGFRYAVNCRSLNQPMDGSVMTYCGGDFASADFDGTLDGFGDSGSSATDSGGSDGGCDGGCGGGCGGD